MYPGIAWRIKGQLTCMCETGFSGTGTALDWGARFGLFAEAGAADAAASTVEDAGGVVFVNAFNGLGTPYYDGSARGALMGMTSSTTPAHVAHALLQSLAFAFTDFYEILTRAFYSRQRVVRVDGGVSRSDFVLQTMSHAANARIQRSAHHEVTSLGAAYLAGLGAGFWASTDELRRTVAVDREFTPDADARARLLPVLQRWRLAVQRACGWPVTKAAAGDGAGEKDKGKSKGKAGESGGAGGAAAAAGADGGEDGGKKGKKKGSVKDKSKGGTDAGAGEEKEAEKEDPAVAAAATFDNLVEV